MLHHALFIMLWLGAVFKTEVAEQLPSEALPVSGRGKEVLSWAVKCHTLKATFIPSWNSPAIASGLAPSKQRKQAVVALQCVQKRGKLGIFYKHHLALPF